MSERLELIPLRDFPMVEPGDDLAAMIAEQLVANQLSLVASDVLVIAQKIVSKAEDCYVRLSDVQISDRARDIAQRADKDPRQVQLVLDESTELVRVGPGVVIVEHRNGYVLANAGIDKSNIVSDEQDPSVLLLPRDADASARALRDGLAQASGIAPQVIINDSVGRPWRNGTVGIAIGTAGLEPIVSQVGDADLFGRELQVTEPALADELAAAASLVMGQAAQGCPVVLARGANLPPGAGDSRSLLRDKARDLFR